MILSCRKYTIFFHVLYSIQIQLSSSSGLDTKCVLVTMGWASGSHDIFQGRFSRLLYQVSRTYDSVIKFADRLSLT